MRRKSLKRVSRAARAARASASPRPRYLGELRLEPAAGWAAFLGRLEALAGPGRRVKGVVYTDPRDGLTRVEVFGIPPRPHSL